MSVSDCGSPFRFRDPRGDRELDSDLLKHVAFATIDDIDLR
jgi:hypothetical protein